MEGQLDKVFGKVYKGISFDMQSRKNSVLIIWDIYGWCYDVVLIIRCNFLMYGQNMMLDVQSVGTIIGTMVMLSLISNLIGKTVAIWVESHIKMIDEEDLRRRDNKRTYEKGWVMRNYNVNLIS